MARVELWTIGERLLAQARELRAAFLDTTIMPDTCFADVPAGLFGGDKKIDAFRAALGYMRDEMVLVRDGKVGHLTVLDDEMANVARLLVDG